MLIALSFFCTYHLCIMSRPTPRKALSLGGHNRKIIHILFRQFPPAIFARVYIGDLPVEEWLHIDTYNTVCLNL